MSSDIRYIITVEGLLSTAGKILESGNLYHKHCGIEVYSTPAELKKEFENDADILLGRLSKIPLTEEKKAVVREFKGFYERISTIDWADSDKFDAISREFSSLASSIRQKLDEEREKLFTQHC